MFSLLHTKNDLKMFTETQVEPGAACASGFHVKFEHFQVTSMDNGKLSFF